MRLNDDISGRFGSNAILLLLHINMGNCCEPETLQSLSLREQTATANPKSNVLASIYSANGINKSNRVAESKLSRDSIGSAHPINDIRFSQSIRHPSLIETPELMEKLNDSQRMDQIYSSKLNIKNSKTVMSSQYSRSPEQMILNHYHASLCRNGVD